jgi:hypothetical protein
MMQSGDKQSPMSFALAQWLFPLVITLHNLEEALWLPAWSQRAGRWSRPVRPGVFRFGAAVFTALAYAAALASAWGGQQSVGAYLLASYALAMLVNACVPHLLATVALRRYMPGTATALALNVPIAYLLLQAAFREGYVSEPAFWVVGIAVGAALAGAIPALFALGEKLGA